MRSEHKSVKDNCGAIISANSGGKLSIAGHEPLGVNEDCASLDTREDCDSFGTVGDCKLLDVYVAWKGAAA
jgi:hypothetical protein